MYEAVGIRKRFGGVVALDGVDFALEPGTVHALLGENGAGKSTLVRILAGALAPDAGRLTLGRESVRFGNTRDALARGVAVVSQEPNLFPDLDVLANLFPRYQHRFARAMVNRAAMARHARPVLAELEFDRPLDTPVERLTLADRQLVEIARALLEHPAVLVLDEPTSALQSDAVNRLMRILDALRIRQVAVCYVSHILEEVMQLCDRITVLRDGRNVLTGVPRAGLTISDVVHAMVGDQPPPARTARMVPPSGPVPRVALRAATVPGVLAAVDLDAVGGEIVGLAGLAGAGQVAVLEVLSGLRRLGSGEVELPDGAGQPKSLRAAIARGIAIVPSDRRRLGLMLDRPIWENIAQVGSVALGRNGALLRRRVLVRQARGHAERLNIKAASVDQLTGALSGGNQQKVVFAKWLDATPAVVLLDDPTRGVDVRAKTEMHAIIRAFAGEGRVVVLTSTDVAELVELCDRVVVFRRGRVGVELSGDGLTEHRLLHVMSIGEATG